MWCALIDNLSAVVMTVFSLRAMIWTLYFGLIVFASKFHSPAHMN